MLCKWDANRPINNYFKNFPCYLPSPNSWELICFICNTLIGWIKGYMHLLSVNTNGEQELCVISLAEL